MPVRVSVNALDLEVIEAEAEQRQIQMSGSRALSYGWSSETTNRVGLLGEHAVTHYLRQHATDQVRLVGSDARSIRDSLGDVEIFVPLKSQVGSSSVSVEVKTTRFSRWRRNGPTVNARQWGRLQAKTIVWCVIADELPTTSVVIMGWLAVEEARASPLNTVVNPLDDNPTVVIKEPLRSPSTLLGWAQAFDFPPF